MKEINYSAKKAQIIWWFREKLALSSIKMALESLSESQFVYQYQGGYIVYDRFFGMRLRDRL